MIPTACKGRIAELKVEQRALELGLTICRPVMDARYDYILDNNGILEKVQVKYASNTSVRDTNSLRIQLEKKRYFPSGRRKSTVYTAGEVDVLFVYVPQLDKVLRFESEDFCGKTAFWVRLNHKTKSGRTSGGKFAKDFIW